MRPMAHAAAAASRPPTGHATVGAAQTAEVACGGGVERLHRRDGGVEDGADRKKPATTTASVASVRSRPLAMRFQTKMAAAMEAAPRKRPSRMPGPPASQPSATGLAETRTTARPPNAAKPMIPVLKRPA